MIGLARTSLAVARQLGGAARAVLDEPVARAQAALDEATAELRAGLSAGDFVAAPVPLFQLRIRLADIALSAVQLELQASGGRASHRDQPLGFARRWREAAFLRIVTHSLVQLQGELLKLAASRAAAA